MAVFSVIGGGRILKKSKEVQGCFTVPDRFQIYYEIRPREISDTDTQVPIYRQPKKTEQVDIALPTEVKK